jgi:hypothetical protein
MPAAPTSSFEQTLDFFGAIGARTAQSPKAAACLAGLHERCTQEFEELKLATTIRASVLETQQYERGSKLLSRSLMTDLATGVNFELHAELLLTTDPRSAPYGQRNLGFICAQLYFPEGKSSRKAWGTSKLLNLRFPADLVQQAPQTNDDKLWNALEQKLESAGPAEWGLCATALGQRFLAHIAP